MPERKEEKLTWAIWDFPKSLKDRFIGLAKIKGKTGREQLIEIVYEWCQKNK